MDIPGAPGDNGAMTSRKAIDEFLAQKRLAVVGVSRTARDYSRLVYREFRSRGYQAVPVNPNAAEVEGERCYPAVGDIDPSVDQLLLRHSAGRWLTWLALFRPRD
jgi:predicted CoA-binding protein